MGRFFFYIFFLGGQVKRKKVPINLYVLFNFVFNYVMYVRTGEGIKGESIAVRIEGLSIEGEIDNDSDGTQTGNIPTVDLKQHLDSPRITRRHQYSNNME